MDGIRKYSKEWFTLKGDADVKAKADLLKEGVENSKRGASYRLDGSIFLGNKEDVMNKVNEYYANPTEDTEDIIKNMQTYGAENIFSVLDANSDGKVTRQELLDFSGTSTSQGSKNLDTDFSKKDLDDFYKNAMAAVDAAVEEDGNTTKISYQDGTYTELKADDKGKVYSEYYEKKFGDGRLGTEYNSQDQSQTKTFMDSEHRPTRIIYDKEDSKRFDSTTDYVYNEDGSKTEKIQTIGKDMTTQFDANGNKISQDIQLKYESDGIIGDTRQSDTLGDCWVLCGVNALRTSEEGQKIIKDSIQQNDDGSVTVNLKGVNRTYTYSAEEIAAKEYSDPKKSYSKGDADMNILEMAIGDFRREKIANGTAKANSRDLNITVGPEATETDPLTGGQADEAIYYLTGLNSVYGSSNDTQETKKELLAKYLDADKSSMAATISFLGKDESVDKDIITGHGYSLVGADDKYVYVENPWNAGKQIAYPIDKIGDNIMQISMTELDPTKAQEEVKPTEPETPQEPAQPAKTEEKQKGFFENVGDFFKKIGKGIGNFFKGLFGG